jgi:hypothetical protein
MPAALRNYSVRVVALHGGRASTARPGAGGKSKNGRRSLTPPVSLFSESRCSRLLHPAAGFVEALRCAGAYFSS